MRLFLLAPQGISSASALYRVADISSDVEWSCETHDTLDMGQDDKRYKNRSKMGVETPKSIFITILQLHSGYDKIVLPTPAMFLLCL